MESCCLTSEFGLVGTRVVLRLAVGVVGRRSSGTAEWILTAYARMKMPRLRDGSVSPRWLFVGVVLVVENQAAAPSRRGTSLPPR